MDRKSKVEVEYAIYLNGIQFDDMGIFVPVFVAKPSWLLEMSLQF